MPGRQNFYPRPPRRGRLLSKTEILAQLAISIHALREEGDGRGRHLRSCQLISIHALREEGDYQHTGGCSGWIYFYPRPPRGGQRLKRHGVIFRGRFLSTPSARRATYKLQSSCRDYQDFYPRPPRGGRPGCGRYCNDGQNFYPRPPRGGRLPLFFKPVSLYIFLSTPSARRATFHLNVFRKCFFPFLSTPSARRATMCHTPLLQSIGISIHALREEGDKGLTRLREGK